MKTTDQTNRFCQGSAVLLLIGIITSGVPGNLIVNNISPQPVWVDIETYAKHFNSIQMLPIWCGFLMLIGFVALIVGIHHRTPEENRVATLLAVASAVTYVTLISLNYILQLAVLKPALLGGHLEGMTFLVFANPNSVTMSIEMLGYAFQGVSTWLIGSAFDQSFMGVSIKWLGKANGIVSIAGAVLQGLNVSLSIENPVGVIAFIGWNILFTLLCLLYVFYFSKLLR